MKTQTLIAHDWTETAPIPALTPDCYELRGSQLAAFEALKDEQFAILNAPTGWGKSIVLIILIAYKLLRNPQLRCIITVPQTIIGHNFARFLQVIVPGLKGTLEWAVQDNLCSPSASNTIESVKEFLSRKPGTLGTLGSRVLVCTHATMAHVFKRLKANEELGLLNNCILWIDEAHHVLNAQVAESDDIVSNTMGSLVLHCVEHANQGLHVGLATATFMRGDKRHIVPEKVMGQFARYNIPYDSYFAEMRPIEAFEFSVICGETFEVAEQLLLKTHCPTIIYLAKRQGSYATDCKYAEIKRMIEIIGKNAKMDGPVIVAGGRRILDLVTEKGRRERQAYLTEKDAQVDVILALDTCKEGFDWPKAEQSIIIGERHSVPEMVQMMGRLFRKYNSNNYVKKHATVFQILPVAVPNTNSFKNNRNAILTVVFSAMLLEDVFVPLAVKGEKGENVPVDKLAPKVPDTKTGLALMRDFLAAIQGISYERSKKLAGPILSKYGIGESEWESTWKGLWTRFAYKTRQLEGLKLNVPFEILKNTDLSGGFLKLASGLCGAMTFQELRKAIGREERSVQEWVIVAEDLAEKHGGQVPNSAWLIKNTLGGLYQVMQRHPELFVHLTQENKGGKTPEEWVPIAEALAEEHGGRVPRCMWLTKHNLGRLHQVMRDRPELFAHLTQEKKIKTPEEWVPIAEDLAEKKGGLVPNSGSLQSNGLVGLYEAMRKRPELFAHLTQDRKTKTAEEWVIVAEDLTLKYGKLPGRAWLNKHQLGGLDFAMQKHRELFTHITQDRKIKTAEEWVIVAEDLALKYGKLPGGKGLNEKGFSGLTRAMRKRPELFAHITQERKRTTPEEWVPIGEDLAEKHGGLPGCKWLEQNNFTCLYRAMRSHPEFFAHIKRK